MLLVSFIAGLIFGIGSGYFEKLLAPALKDSLSLSDSEMSIVSFGGLMLLAAIVVSAMGADSSAFWLVLGGVIGAFAIRGYAMGKAKMEERNTLREAQNTAEDVAEDVAETATDTYNQARG